MSSDILQEDIIRKTMKNLKHKDDDEGKTTNHIVITQILSQNISNKNKVSQITQFYDEQQKGIILQERYAKEFENLSSKFFPTKNKNNKQKESTCLNTCCFLPRVCCNSTVFITKILISFLFILVVLAFIILVKNIFGRIFY